MGLASLDATDVLLVNAYHPETRGSPENASVLHRDATHFRDLAAPRLSVIRGSRSETYGG